MATSRFSPRLIFQNTRTSSTTSATSTIMSRSRSPSTTNTRNTRTFLLIAVLVMLPTILLVVPNIYNSTQVFIQHDHDEELTSALALTVALPSTLPTLTKNSHWNRSFYYSATTTTSTTTTNTITTNATRYNTQTNTPISPIPPTRPLRIYVHIGPHKTGSTFLQGVLAKQNVNLNQDNLYYIGKVNKEFLQFLPPKHDLIRPLLMTGTRWHSSPFSSLMSTTINISSTSTSPSSNTNISSASSSASSSSSASNSSTLAKAKAKSERNMEQVRRKFVQQLQTKHLSKGHDVILSGEEFSKNANAVANTLELLLRHQPLHQQSHPYQHPYQPLQPQPKRKLEVHVIMVHRRYFDLALSWYHWHFGQSKAKHWSPTTSTVDGEHHRPIPCFRDGISRTITRKQQQQHTHTSIASKKNKKTSRSHDRVQEDQEHTFRDLLQAYNDDDKNDDDSVRFVDKMHIVNMHDLSPYPDLGSFVVCTILETATHACQALLQETTTVDPSKASSVMAAGNSISISTSTTARRDQDQGTKRGANVDPSRDDPYFIDYERMAVFYFNNHAKLQKINEQAAPSLHTTRRRRQVVRAFQNKFQNWKEDRIPTVIAWETRSHWKDSSFDCNAPVQNRSALEQYHAAAVTATIAHPIIYSKTNANANTNTTTGGIIPLVCPTKQEYDFLSKETLETEIMLFPTKVPKDFSDRLEEHIRLYKFCNLDLDLLFQEDDWKQFLQCLLSAQNGDKKTITLATLCA